MIFGRKDVTNPQLEAQRQHLARTEQQLVILEQGVSRLESYKAGTFSDVWFDSAEVVNAASRVGEARSLFDEVSAGLANASSPVAGAESQLALIDRSLADCLLVLDSFAAELVGRLHIWNEPHRNPDLAFDPSVRESQQALYASATKLAGAVQKHIDELRAIQAQHQEYWPPKLNLPHLQSYLDDGRRALAILEQQLAAQSGPLSPQSSIDLLLLAQRMEQGVEMIEGERANLAVEIITRAALKNSGLR